ncbi:MAG TPA: LysM peptidoglycan-binding domain-containing protein [Roseiflexaceae bacterium]|nr:LysM peptidoglycan-binding domain-containing protein [Roseiflexaceae bacterium]
MTTTSSTTGELSKATIRIYFQSKKGDMGTPEDLECRFNPKEYTISYSNSWNVQSAEKSDIGLLKFQSRNPSTLKLQLLFDDYDIYPGKSGTDLKTSIDLLRDAMRIRNVKGSDKKEPAPCQFCWGEKWSFTAVITNLSQKFTLFDATGKPLRALVDITFLQVEDEEWYPKQNPTSGGGTGEHIRVVKSGDTLAGIAFEEYGDPTVWRHLADTNKIRNPLNLSPGQELLISPLPLV